MTRSPLLLLCAAAFAACATPQADHGLRVGPKASGSVYGVRPNSGVLLRPAMTTPAAWKRRTSSLSRGIGSDASARLPLPVGSPCSVPIRSFSRKGTPANGAVGSTCAACARAAS